MPTVGHRAAFGSLAGALGRSPDFLALTKPRVMGLAIFTAVVGMVLAPGGMPPWAAILATLAIALGAGGAGALNMWFDAPADARMARTAARPLPRGRVTSREALVFGLGLTAVSVGLLGAVANWPAAALLLGTVAFYAVIYTMWLKYRTAQNIVIGGAAGALPPVIGWAAASGTVDWRAWILFGIVFLWTPPHFWSLALVRTGDYAAARIPMLPVVAGEAATKRQILAYSALLAPAGAAPWLAGIAGPAYGLVALALGAEFLRRAVVLARADAPRGPARSLFGYSILYLFALFAVLLAEAVAARLLTIG